MHRKSRVIFNLIVLALFVFGLVVKPAQTPVLAEGEQRPLAVPVPTLVLSAPSNPYIGENLTISLVFNNPSDTGYGPYIDLFLPLSGADGLSEYPPSGSGVYGPNDGISFNNATYLNQPVESQVMSCPAGTTVVHPLTGLNVLCPAQPAGLYSPFEWQMVVLTLPFGSYVSDQPDAEILVNTSLSNYADLGVGLPIYAQSGFMFGADPLNNPGSDPVIIGSLVNTTPNPTAKLVTLTKSYNGPENETATGENFPRRYTVTATIADGQTVENLVVTDQLPDNMQFKNLISTSPAASCSTPSTTTPGGDIQCAFAFVTGSAQIVFEYYIPLEDAGSSNVIDPDDGDDENSCNQVIAVGDWDPEDERDEGSTGNVNENPDGCEHNLEDKSIAVQKSVNIVEGGSPAPGKTLEYTINFQISDYFAFQDVFLEDVFTDGQHFDPSFVPTLSVQGNGFISSGNFSASNFDVSCNYSGLTPPPDGSNCTIIDPDADDGTTAIEFRVSDELFSRRGDGKLIGGCLPLTGTGGADPDCNGTNDGPTTGTIVFHTTILEEFVDAHNLSGNSGDSSVDQGDVLGNSVDIFGDILDNDDFLDETGSAEDDDSGDEVVIPYGVITKSIYALNGSTSFASVRVAPGDAVTYRVTYTLPTSDFEDLEISDYLPLPIFDAAEVTTFNNSVCGIPAAGLSCYGPGDTYHLLSGANIPGLTTSGPLASNSITWTYGDDDAVGRPSSVIDLLFTVTVKDDPFADGLFLTNQAQAVEGSTNAEGSEANNIVQIQLTEPVVGITKGAVWTNRTDLPLPVFTPDPPGPVSFDGSSGTCSGRLGGLVTSAGLETNPVNSDLANLDAADTVMMALILENTGRYDAFDVSVRDLLPAGLTYVPSSLCVTNGAGADIPYTNIGGGTGLFDQGIELTDSGSGALLRGKDSVDQLNSEGTNIAVITYLVSLDSSVEPGETYTNTGTLFNFAGVNGGPDHTTVDLDDDASVSVYDPSLVKSLTDTNQTFTENRDVTIGEVIEYTVTVTVPEGTTNSVQVQDQLDSGLAFVGCTSITPSTGVTTTGDFNNACANPTVTYAGTNTPVNQGRLISFNLGNILNSNTDNTTADTITIVYQAIVINSTGNNAGLNRNNAATITWDNGSDTASADNATLVEPVLQVDKTASPTTGDAADEITFSITLVNSAPTSGTDAFDIQFLDDLSSLPFTVTSVGTPSFTGTTCGTPSVTDNSSGDIIDLLIDTLSLGCSMSLTYSATLDGTVTPEETIQNTASATWTSIPGSLEDPSSHTDLDCERSGDTEACGTSANDYSISDPAVVTVNSASFTKTLVGSGVVSSNNENGEAVIGETIDYQIQLTIPEAEVPNVTIEDQLDAGLAFVGCLGISASDGLQTSLSGGFSDACPLTPENPALNPTLSGDARTITFDLGDITNINTDNGTPEVITINYRVVVLNVNENQTDTLRNNVAEPFSGSTSLADAASAAEVRVIEPTLQVQKAATIGGDSVGLPGENVVYTLTITNSSETDAFDTILTDALPKVDPPGDPRSLITSPSITSAISSVAGNVAGNFTLNGDNASGWVLNTIADFNVIVGETITIVIEGPLLQVNPPAVSADQLITNEVDMTWTSLDGTPGQISIYATDSVERDGTDGTGGLNDYASSDDADIRVENITLSKQLINLGDGTVLAGQDVRIGDTIGYRVTFTIPRDVFLTDLTFDDVMDAGLAFVDCESITADAALVSSLTDAFTCSNATIAVTNNGENLDIGFGDVDNTDLNNAHTIVLEYSAVVLNLTTNDRNDTLDNQVSANFTVNGGTTTLNASAPDVTINEPTLTVEKIVDQSTGDAGNTVQFTITIESLTGTNFNDAYNVVVEDIVPDGLTYVGGSFTHTSGLVPTTGPTYTGGTNTLSAEWDVFAPGQTSVFTYQAVINATVAPNQEINNIAEITWTSMPGVITNPSVYNDLDCERTGDISGCGTTANDYSDDSTATVTVNDVQFDKTLTSTSASHTSGNDLTIGERASFALTIVLPEGSIPSLTVTDLIPSGMAYVANSFAIDTTNYNGTYDPPVVTPLAGTDGANGQDLVIEFGQIITTNDNDTTNNTLVINLDAVVLNTLPNQSGVNLVNQGSFQIGTNPVVNSNTVTMPIVEPELSITKTFDSTDAPFEAGETVPYQLVITNASGLTAFDVEISDFAYANVSNVTVADSPTSSLVGLNNLTTGNHINFTIAEFPSGSTLTIDYDVVLPTSLQVGETVENTADVHWTSLTEDGDPNERSGSSGDPLNNYYDEDDQTFTTEQPVIIKSVDKTDATIGEVVRYTLSITSPLGTIEDWVITDSLPTGLIYIGNLNESGFDFPDPTVSTPNDGSVPVTLAWDMSAVPVVITNNSMTISFDVVVADVGSNFDGVEPINEVEMTYTDGDDTPQTLSDDISFMILEPLLQVDKNFTPNPVGLGQTAFYTITLSHDTSAPGVSSTDAFDILIEDDIPAGLSYQAGTISGSCPSGVLVTPDDSSATTLSWTVDHLPLGQSCELTYQVTVTATALNQTLTNSVTGDYSTLPGIPTPDEERDYTISDSVPLLTTGPDLRVEKTDSGVTAVPGGNIVYAITYWNDGNGEATNVVLTESIPDYTTFNDAATTSPWVCGVTSCTLSLGTLAPAATGTVDFVVTVDASIPPGVSETTNTVSITDDGNHGSDPTPANNSDTDTTPLDANPDLEIVKTDAIAEVTPGNVIGYTLTYDNIGVQDATGVVITETVPTGTIFTTAGSDPRWSCLDGDGAGTPCTINIGSVAVDDAPGSVTFAVIVDSPLAEGIDQIDNTASIADDGNNGPEPMENNEDDEDTPVNAVPDLIISKTDDVDPTTPGGTIVYALTYDNIGNQTATGVVITETVPDYTTFNATLSEPGWSCSDGDPAGTTCTYSVGTLSADSNTSIDFAVDVINPVPAGVNQIDNAVLITDDGSNGADPTPENNSDLEDTTLNAAPDLTITKVDDVEIIQTGQVLTYTLDYANVGNQDATGVVIMETIPDHTSFGEGNDPAWVCVPDGNAGSTCTFPVGNLAAGATGQINFIVITDAIIDDAVESIINYVSIGDDGSNGEDPTPGNNEDDEETPIDALPDLRITKSYRVNGIPDATALPGETIVYGLSYENVGDQDSSGVVITETVPDHTSFNADESNPAWVCTDVIEGSTCTYDVGNLAADESGAVLFAVTIEDPLTAGVEEILNYVSIADDGTNGEDPTPENNEDDASTPVDAYSDLTITKDDGVVQVSPGQALVYTIEVANVGTQNASGVVVTDTLPEGVVFVSASDGGVYDEDTHEILWDLGEVAAGSSVTLTVNIAVEEPFTGLNPEIVNEVIVEDDGSNGTDPTPENNEDDDRDLIGESDKMITETNQNFTSGLDVAIGEVVTYQVTLDLAPGLVEDLVFTDIVDQGMAFIGCNEITTDPDAVLTLEPGYTLSSLCTMASISSYPSGSPNVVDGGRQMVINFGDVTNTSIEDISLTITYDVVILNSLDNLDGQSLNNQAAWTWVGGSLEAEASPVTIVEPDVMLSKTVAPETAYSGQTVTYTLTIQHTTESQTEAFNLNVTDTLPIQLTYVPGSLMFVSGQVPTEINDTYAPALRVSWDVFDITTEPTIITYEAEITGGSPNSNIVNDAEMDWTSLPGDVDVPQSPYNNSSVERSYIPGSNVDVYGVIASAQISIPALPETGFAPNVVTIVPQQPLESSYNSLGDLRFSIPKQNLDLPIVGVPLAAQGWDLTWLSNQVGYLEGTAYPTWNGNTGLTAHVYNADGSPGPFVNLHLLRWGDRVEVSAFGKVYTYEVRSVSRVSANDLSVLNHEDRSWLTLITCQGYNENTEQYTWRVVVKAVLISVVDQP